jgi:hypothetical protein
MYSAFESSIVFSAPRDYTETYTKTSTLHHGRKPTFDQILERIGEWIDRL